MEECQAADTNGLASCLRYLGRNQRGWHVFVVDARPSGGADGDSPPIFRVVMVEKVLKIVQQEVEMTVCVNPDSSRPDEWVIGGELWKIASLQMESSFGPTTVGGNFASVPLASSSRRARRG